MGEGEGLSAPAKISSDLSRTFTKVRHSSYAALMDTSLNRRMVEAWQLAAQDLGIRVTAPVELLNADGKPFQCEAFVEDFGSPKGAVIVSSKTERRIRQSLRSLGDEVWVSRDAGGSYRRKGYVDMLLDWGWFGEQGAEPGWYSERNYRSR